MAGCLNGGAQLRPQGGVTLKELTSSLETLYRLLPVQFPEDDFVVKDLYKQWLEGQESDKAMSILHTHYNAVEKLDNALNIKW